MLLVSGHFTERLPVEMCPRVEIGFDGHSIEIVAPLAICFPLLQHDIYVAGGSITHFGELRSLPFTFIAWTVALDPSWLPVPAAASTQTLAAFQNPLNGAFESMSGFTGTGLTMTDHEDVLPHTLQWWRSLTEWVGGVGVIVLTTTILARPGSGSLTLRGRILSNCVC